jgi:uncharacterized integral membrane protein
MVEQSSGGSATGVAEGQRARLSSGVIASLIGVGLLVIFMVQNTQPVTLQFLFWSFTWPLWLFTLVMALVGGLVWIGWAWCAVIGAARRAATTDGIDNRLNEVGLTESACPDNRTSQPTSTVATEDPTASCRRSQHRVKRPQPASRPTCMGGSGLWSACCCPPL